MDLRFIFDLSLKDEEVLCLFRKDKSYGSVYRGLVSKFSSQYLNVSSPDTISEYKGSAKYWIDVKKYTISDYSLEDLEIFKTVIDIPAIRRKERFFRTGSNYYDAHDLLVSCTKFFIEFFKSKNYKIIVTHSVDNYVLDVMTRVAKHYGIQVVGIILFFYSGYVRITSHGEHNTLRIPDDDEVDSIYNRMLAKEKTAFKINKAHIYKEVVRQYFTYKAKYLIHYLIFHKLMNKWEYDYAGTRSFEYPRKIGNFFPNKFFEQDLSSVKTLKKDKSIYLPLHFFPEATVEFWVDDPSISPYYPSLFETVQKLSNKGYNILIKEHPAFFFKRNLDIYKTLKAIKNVYLIKPFISTYDVLELVDYTVVWTGTSGIESLMQDKKVVIVSENYYSNNELCRIDEIESAQVFTPKQKKDLIRRVLANCVKLERF